MIFEKVQKIIAENCDINVEDIKLETNLKDDLKLDSLDAVELLMEVENEFDIIVDDQDWQKINTVKDIVKYIEAK